MEPLDHFDAETKLRQLVSELIEPTVRRMLEEKEHNMSMRDGVELLTHKVNELEYLTHKSLKKTKQIEDFAHLIHDLKNKSVALDSKI
jgi:hypothetical protein